MAQSPIKDDHHIVRLCKNRLLIREGDDIVGVYPELFRLREASKDRPRETYLSAVYYEFFDGTHEERMSQCRNATAYPAKNKDAFIRMNVGTLKSTGFDHGHKLRVLHKPKANNRAYAGVDGLPTATDDELCTALAVVAAMEAVTEVRVIEAWIAS